MKETILYVGLFIITIIFTTIGIFQALNWSKEYYSNYQSKASKLEERVSRLEKSVCHLRGGSFYDDFGTCFSISGTGTTTFYLPEFNN